MKTYIIFVKPPVKELIDWNDEMKIYKSIKSFEKWAHPQENLWLVKSDLSAKEVFDKITLIGRTDILISEMNENYYGILDKRIWNWIKLA